MFFRKLLEWKVKIYDAYPPPPPAVLKELLFTSVFLEPNFHEAFEYVPVAPDD